MVTGAESADGRRSGERGDGRTDTTGSARKEPLFAQSTARDKGVPSLRNAVGSPDPARAALPQRAIPSLGADSPKTPTEITVVAEEEPEPKKILRVREGYGEARVEVFLLEEEPQASPMQEQLVIEQEVLAAFKAQGYIVKRGGEFNPANPHEIGILARDDMFRNDYGRNRQIAQESGAVMPPSYATPEEILDTDDPVVAKWNFGQRGVNKFLLDTEEKKVKFLTFTLLSGDVIHELASEGNAEEQISEAMEQVRRRDFSGPLAPDAPDSAFADYHYEAFIETPSDHNTSFRIVSDAFGNVDHGILLYSLDKKGERILQDPDDNAQSITEIINHPWEIHKLLTHPASPLYIASADITSNSSRGGKKIFLNGEPLTDPVERDIALAHGVNPDNPQIPNPLHSLSSKIGKASRGDYPYVGSDFLQTRTGSPPYYFPETNPGPGIYPEDLGLDPTEYSEADSTLIMMRRAANSANIAEAKQLATESTLVGEEARAETEPKTPTENAREMGFETDDISAEMAIVSDRLQHPLQVMPALVVLNDENIQVLAEQIAQGNIEVQNAKSWFDSKNRIIFMNEAHAQMKHIKIHEGTHAAVAEIVPEDFGNLEFTAELIKKVMDRQISLKDIMNKFLIEKALNEGLANWLQKDFDPDLFTEEALASRTASEIEGALARIRQKSDQERLEEHFTILAEGLDAAEKFRDITDPELVAQSFAKIEKAAHGRDTYDIGQFFFATMATYLREQGVQDPELAEWIKKTLLNPPSTIDEFRDPVAYLEKLQTKFEPAEPASPKEETKTHPTLVDLDLKEPLEDLRFYIGTSEVQNLAEVGAETIAAAELGIAHSWASFFDEAVDIKIAFAPKIPIENGRYEQKSALFNQNTRVIWFGMDRIRELAPTLHLTEAEFVNWLAGHEGAHFVQFVTSTVESSDLQETEAEIMAKKSLKSYAPNAQAFAITDSYVNFLPEDLSLAPNYYVSRDEEILPSYPATTEATQTLTDKTDAFQNPEIQVLSNVLPLLDGANNRFLADAQRFAGQILLKADKESPKTRTQTLNEMMNVLTEYALHTHNTPLAERLFPMLPAADRWMLYAKALDTPTLESDFINLLAHWRADLDTNEETSKETTASDQKITAARLVALTDEALQNGDYDQARQLKKEFLAVINNNLWGGPDNKTPRSLHQDAVYAYNCHLQAAFARAGLWKEVSNLVPHGQSTDKESQITAKALAGELSLRDRALFRIDKNTFKVLQWINDQRKNQSSQMPQFEIRLSPSVHRLLENVAPELLGRISFQTRNWVSEINLTLAGDKIKGAESLYGMRTSIKTDSIDDLQAALLMSQYADHVDASTAGHEIFYNSFIQQIAPLEGYVDEYSQPGRTLDKEYIRTELKKLFNKFYLYNSEEDLQEINPRMKFLAQARLARLYQRALPDRNVGSEFSTLTYSVQSTWTEFEQHESNTDHLAQMAAAMQELGYTYIKRWKEYNDGGYLGYEPILRDDHQRLPDAVPSDRFEPESEIELWIQAAQALNELLGEERYVIKPQKETKQINQWREIQRRIIVDGNWYTYDTHISELYTAFEHLDHGNELITAPDITERLDAIMAELSATAQKTAEGATDTGEAIIFENLE
jgi:hypothetical protein